MAKMQACLLTVIVLLSPAAQVFGRVVPHDIPRKPIKVPDPVKGGLDKKGDFAKFVDGSHGTQNGKGEGSGHTTGHAFGSKSHHETHTQGEGTIILKTDGKGHGDARVTGHAGGFTKVGHTVSGGVVHGASRSNRDGDGELKIGKATGTATDGRNKDVTSGRVELESIADAKFHGSTTSNGRADAGGAVKKNTVSGIKGTTRDHATNNADSDTDVLGFTHAENKNKKDTAVAHGHTDTDSDASANNASANGKGVVHGGSKADKAFATVEAKGTSLSRNKKTEAEGEGTANGHSTDNKHGKKESYADSSALAKGKEESFSGEAKGTGKAIGHSGVKHNTEAFSKADTSFNTKSKAQGVDTRANAAGKHVAALKNGHGTVSAGGSTKTVVSKGLGDSSAHGSAHAEKGR